MKEKIAEILKPIMTVYSKQTDEMVKKDAVKSILALIEQEQKPMRRALELAKIQIEFAQSIHWLNSGEEILVKIDAVLGGSHE